MFSNIWDVTFPPDTQAANQLGADLRSLRTDVMERMGAISGLEADRPTFEAGFSGVLYFCTDTGKWFRWTGVTWADVTDQIATGLTASGMGLATVAETGKFTDLIDIGTVFAGVHATKGYQKFPGNFMIQWATGVQDASGSAEPAQTIGWEIAFAACYNVMVTTQIAVASVYADAFYQVISFGTTTVNVQRQHISAGDTREATTPMVVGIGTYA